MSAQMQSLRGEAGLKRDASASASEGVSGTGKKLKVCVKRDASASASEGVSGTGKKLKVCGEVDGAAVGGNGAVELVAILVKGLGYNLASDGLNAFATRQPNDTIEVSQETENERDKNALVVHLVTPGGKKLKTGYVAKEQASLLSPMITRGCSFSDVKIINEEYPNHGKTIVLSCQFECDEQDRAAVQSLSHKKHSTVRSSTVPAAWAGAGAGSSSGASMSGETWPSPKEGPNLATAPASSLTIARASKDFIKKRFASAHTQGEPSALWIPRTDEELEALGAGKNSDTEFWRRRGLRPPNQWVVEAAQLCNPEEGTLDDTLRGSSLDDQRGGTKATPKEREREMALRGTAWGVTNCWLPEHLKELDDLIKKPIWQRLEGSAKKLDQLIAVFGSPYVLGQDAPKLKLVMPHSNATETHTDTKNLVWVDEDHHTPATKKHCKGKNLVYAVIMGEAPVLPGFNTLIFGLCWRGSGFGYHADQVEGLPAKDVTMVPKQPVATTVLYEKPGTEGDVVDDGKDSVFWIPKPLIAGASRYNGQSRFGGTYDNEYCAFMSLQTSHGGEHIQAAGQQQIAKHGVFPTLPIGRADKYKPREGARIAITARISPIDARGGAELFRNKGAYKEIIDCASSQPIAIAWNPYVFDT